MAHNTVINAGAGGDTIADYDLAAGGAYPTAGKVQLGAIYVSPNSTTAPTPVTPANPFPVHVTDATLAVTQSGTWAVVSAGSVASGATDSGNPVKVAGVYHSTPVTLTDGQRGDLQLDANGYLKINLVTGGGGGGSNAAASATGSAVPASADFAGLNIAGTLRGRTGVNPSGSVYAAQTDLSSVGGTSFALGQQLAAASVPVVLTAAQITTLTPPTTITANAGSGTFTVSGTVTANAGTGTFAVSATSLPLPSGAATDATLAKLTVAQGAALGSNTQALVGGSVTTAAPTYTTGQVSPFSLTTAGSVRVDGSGATQPISGTVTANAGTNLNTSLLALESGGNLATLAGAVTSSKVQANVAQVNGVTPLMGNGVTGTGSQRVTIASDNTAFTVNAAQSGTWNVTNVSGTVSLPTGASTSAKQPALGTAGTASADVISIQGVASMTAVKVDGSAVTQPASLSAATTGGATPYRFLAAGGANQDSTVVKASAGQLFSIALGNPSAATRYVKFYDASSGPTSASTPVLVYFLPAGGGSNVPLNAPIAFGTGISFRITTGISDNDANVATAGDVVVSLGYK